MRFVPGDGIWQLLQPTLANMTLPLAAFPCPEVAASEVGVAESAGVSVAAAASGVAGGTGVSFGAAVVAVAVGAVVGESTVEVGCAVAAAAGGISTAAVETETDAVGVTIWTVCARGAASVGTPGGTLVGAVTAAALPPHAALTSSKHTHNSP